MKKMSHQELIIWGAGEYGMDAAQIFEKDCQFEILFVVDSDKEKWGGTLHGYPICSPDKLMDGDINASNFLVVIAVADYVPIVLKLESMGVYNYTYWQDVYQNNYRCNARKILDQYIADSDRGQYTGETVKNGWMNHCCVGYGHEKRHDNCMMPEMKILDVGSGCGKNMFYWLCKGYDAWGIDCCDWKLEFCRQKVDDFGFDNEWKERFCYGYGENLPWEDNSFDLVTSWFVLEHVQDWRKCLREMFRVVRVGGTLFIDCPDYSGRYEPHYGISINESIAANPELLQQKVKELDYNRYFDTFDELNFITHEDVISEIEQIKETEGLELVVEDINLEHPERCVERINNQVCINKNTSLIVKVSSRV